jgi:pyrimidine-specific ribonucleoside hydrolase
VSRPVPRDLHIRAHQVCESCNNADLAHRPHGQDGPVPVPLVVDTDPGIDDAVALLLALASPEVDLRLVTTVHGNVDVSRATQNALRILHLAGRVDVPVASGAREPLAGPRPRRPDPAHGPGGLGGLELPPSPATADPRPAVAALADVLLGSASPVTVAAIGPLTNLAQLLGGFPDAPRRIGRLVVMGGRTSGEPTEFNVRTDPEAARAVLAAGLPTVLVGLDVTLRVVLSPGDLARLAGAGPIAARIAGALESRRDHSRQSYGVDGVVVNDALALVEAIAPGTVGTVPASVAVDTSSGPGRGRTVVDRRRDAPGAVQVAETVDGAAVVAFLLDRLASLDRR